MNSYYSRPVAEPDEHDNEPLLQVLEVPSVNSTVSSLKFVFQSASLPLTSHHLIAVNPPVVVDGDDVYEPLAVLTPIAAVSSSSQA